MAGGGKGFRDATVCDSVCQLFHERSTFGPAPVSVSLALSDAVTRALKDSLPSCSGFALIERTGDTSEIRTTPDAIVVIRSRHYGLCYEEYTGMQGKSDDQKDVA